MIQFSSPGLCAILDKMKSSKHNHILDLGEMRSGTFNHFSELSCKFHFENLREFIVNQQAEPKDQFLINLDEYLTDYAPDTRFDVILLWDLINFITIDEFVYLFEKLKPYCKENTLVYSISYMTKSIPSIPSRFQIINHGSLEIVINKELIKNVSEVTTLSIVRNLPDFMDETNLFSSSNARTGITESLLRYVPHLRSNQKNLITKKHSFLEKITQPLESQKETGGFKRHLSPGLIYTLRSTKKIMDAKILNLGKDIKSNNKILLQFSESVFREDLLSATTINNKYEMAFKKNTLSYNSGIKFDAIFAWDLFNFYDEEALEKISDKLSQCCKPGTLIYIINYSCKEKPVGPQDFHIGSKGYVNFVPQKLSTDIPLSLNSTLISKIFKNTKTKKSFVLEKGMAKGYCEYILECQ